MGAPVRPRGWWGAACGTKYRVRLYCMCCEYDYKFVHCKECIRMYPEHVSACVQDLRFSFGRFSFSSASTHGAGPLRAARSMGDAAVGAEVAAAEVDQLAEMPTGGSKEPRARDARKSTREARANRRESALESGEERKRIEFTAPTQHASRNTSDAEERMWFGTGLCVDI